jgi:hypothetical protein
MRAIAIVFVASALFGCAADVTPDDAGDAVAPGSVITSLALHQTGGFIGADQSFVLASDGSVTTSGRGSHATGTMHAPGGASDARALFAAVSSSGALSVAPAAYLPGNPCCDRIVDQLTIATEAGPRMYTFMSDGADAPASLLAATRLINTYIANAQ